MNKGKKEVKLINGTYYTGYHCNRCHVWIEDLSWLNDKHKNCDRYFKNKFIRDNVNERLFKKKNKI